MATVDKIKIGINPLITTLGKLLRFNIMNLLSLKAKVLIVYFYQDSLRCEKIKIQLRAMRRLLNEM